MKWSFRARERTPHKPLGRGVARLLLKQIVTPRPRRPAAPPRCATPNQLRTKQPSRAKQPPPTPRKKEKKEKKAS